MSYRRYRPLNRYFIACWAFFGAFTAYAVVMAIVLAAAGDGPGNRESNACSSCHSNSNDANMIDLSIWGGSYHNWGDGGGGGSGGSFPGVPNGFRM